MNRRLIILSVAAATLALPAVAHAHVTVQPPEVPAGGFARLDVRVPNERDDAATDRVAVQMPDGFASASYEPVPGWTVDVKMERLAEPIETEHGKINSQVRTITWTADDPAAAIQPGQFRDFGISVGLPDSAQPGDALTFPAIQTYDSGEVVRWIGDPDSDEPAAQVMVTEPTADAHSAAGDQAGASDDGEDDGGGAPTWLVVVALVLGAGGLAAGVAGLRGRRI